MEGSPVQQLWDTVLDVLPGQNQATQQRLQSKAAEKYLQFKSFDCVPQNVPIKHHSVFLKVALMPRFRPSSSSQGEEGEGSGPTHTVIKAVGGGLEEEEEEGGPTHKSIPSELRAGQSENMSLKTMKQ